MRFGCHINRSQFCNAQSRGAAPSTNSEVWDFWNHSDVICFFVGPRKKGNHHGFWVNCNAQKMWWVVVFDVFDRGNWGKTRKMLTKSNQWVCGVRSLVVGGTFGMILQYYILFLSVLKDFPHALFKNKCLHLWLKPGHRLFTRQISSGLRYRQRLQVVVWHMSKQWSKHSLVLIFAGGYIAQLHIDCKISMNV